MKGSGMRVVLYVRSLWVDGMSIEINLQKTLKVFILQFFT